MNLTVARKPAAGLQIDLRIGAFRLSPLQLLVIAFCAACSDGRSTLRWFPPARPASTCPALTRGHSAPTG